MELSKSNNIIFIGLMYDKDEEIELTKNSKIGLQAAANTYQWALINGLESVLKSSINIVSCLPVGPYPSSYKKIILKNQQKERHMSIYAQLGCINIPVIKQISREHKLYYHIDNLLKKNPVEHYTIILYSLYDPYIYALKKLKAKYSSRLEVVPVVTDLPAMYGVIPTNKIDRLVYMFRGKKILKCANSFDKYILLTPNMAEPLNIKDKPYMIVEGIADNYKYSEPFFDQSEKIVLYTGTLHRSFGIDKLLQAFDLIKDNSIHLYLCGDGNMKEEILQLSQTKENIFYCGFIPKEEIRNLQKKASILINPRENNELFAKYSFPSKTIEYMLSGVPIIMNKLSGVPDEYYKYVYTPKNNTVEALAEIICDTSALSSTEKKRIGEQARSFVINNKSGIVQAQRIIDFICGGLK